MYISMHEINLRRSEKVSLRLKARNERIVKSFRRERGRNEIGM